MGARRDEAGGWIPAQSPQELREGVEANLRSLHVERLDLVNLRLLDEGEGPAVPVAEQLGALEDLRQEGKLDLIDISNVDLDRAEQALELVDVGQIQNSYSIIDRGDDPLVELVREREIAFVPFFALARRSPVDQPSSRRTPRSPRSPRSTARRRPRSRSRGCSIATSGCC